MGRFEVNRFPVQNNFSGSNLISGEYSPHKLRSAGADQACQAQHLSFSQSEADIMNVFIVQILYFQNNIAELVVSLQVGIGVANCTSNHCPNQFVFVCL